MARTPDFARYLVACDYPGTIDPLRVAECLHEYLRALSVQRHVRQLPIGWSLTSEDPLRRTALAVLRDFARRNGQNAIAASAPHNVVARLAAHDALVARGAMVACYDALVTRGARAAVDARESLDARILLAARGPLAALSDSALGARDAIDARDARTTARNARNAIESLEALDACDGIDALVAIEALNAHDALNARDAREARDAFDAQDALEARITLLNRGTLTARDAWVARDAWAARDAFDALAARDAWAARAASDALIARDALDASLFRFASWCLHRGWSWWNWDLSWMSTTWLGAQQLGHDIPWARPLFEAFIAGAWFLSWCDDTLYWIAKPVVRAESFNGGRRLHCADGPALESDAENVYFWHGVIVPAFVVTQPTWITLNHIQREKNAEVRRVMLDRYGLDRYVQDTGALPISADDFGTLYRIEQNNDDPLVVISLRNATVEPDGSSKQYMLRVDPTLRPLPPGEWSASRKLKWFGRQAPQALTARNAVASLHGLRGEEYRPVVET